MPEDPTPDPDAPPEGEPKDADTEPFDLDRAKAKIAKANSEAEGLRKRLKELEPLAKKAQELEESQKSEQQKVLERAEAAEKRAAAAETELLRLQVGAAKGLTPAQARRLVGTTAEELEADADDLLASFRPDDQPGDRMPRRPVERLRGGGDPTAEPEETDPEKLAALVRRG